MLGSVSERCSRVQCNPIRVDSRVEFHHDAPLKDCYCINKLFST